MYVTHLCLISRPGAFNLVEQNLKSSLRAAAHNEVLLIIDNNKIPALPYVRLLASLPLRNGMVLPTKNPPPSHFTMPQRRNRIAAAHNLAKEHIGGSDFVFGFEDDSVLPAGALRDLLADYKSLDDRVGIIEGVQVGRWGRPYVGAWQLDDLEHPQQYRSLKPASGIQPIDAGGLYCFITPTSLYKQHSFGWAEPMGPDVNYGRWLRQQGYSNYIDWGIKCGHQVGGSIINVDSKVVELYVQFKQNRWHYTPKAVAND